MVTTAPYQALNVPASKRHQVFQVQLIDECVPPERWVAIRHLMVGGKLGKYKNISAQTYGEKSKG